LDANHTPHEIVGPEEVVREFRRASRAASTPPEVKVMCGRVLREMAKFEAWCEPLFDEDTPRVTKVVEQAATLEEYAAFTLRIMRRAELGKPCPEVDDDGTILATDEDIIREVVNALAACRRFFWAAKHEWAKATAKAAATPAAPPTSPGPQGAPPTPPTRS
jgi:hypothetical protein